ncbi:Calcineurin-like phosphoesterase [Phycisphaerae bacterium RAS1]|nr:Calcineurin-like phosphoesterase [Phycisphaerae bacterium RAS1]
MLVCFASDLHGRPTLYEQLEKIITDARPALVILGGDNHIDGDLDDPVGTQVGFIRSDLMPRIRRWLAAYPTMRVATILGNHDWRCAEIETQRSHDAGDIVLLDPRRPWSWNGTTFVGYSNTPPTPYWVKDFERLDLPTDAAPETGGAIWDAAAQRAVQAPPESYFTSRPSIAEDLDAIQPPAGRWILVCHAPPFDSKLDRLPHLDFPIGSQAVRRFISRTRPAIALHGHIHESPQVTGDFRDHVGGVLCVNPGQGRDELHAVLFDSDDPERTLRHSVFG